jgi:hypothetical protein
VQLKRKDVHSNTKEATKKLRGCAMDTAKGAALTRLYEISRSLIKEVLGATDTPVVSSPLAPSAAYYSPLPNATDINKVHCTGETGMAQSLSLQSDVGTLPYRLFSQTSCAITCNACPKTVNISSYIIYNNGGWVASLTITAAVA